MTNLSKISLPLLLVVLSVTIASPVKWPDDGNCDGVVGASIGNCNLNCQTTDRDGFEIEGDDLSNLILFLFCNLKDRTYNYNSNSGITTPIEDCVTFADHYNETNQGQARGYGHITSYACRPHGANTSNFNNSLTAQYF